MRDDGGMVFRAYQPAVGREVAIKVIRADLANDPGFIRRFQTEAQVVATLEHPHIVPLYDYWREPDAAYLVTRLMRGSLTTVLERGALTPTQTITMIDQLGDALQTAHRSGVVHGDIKPDNVLIDGDGNAYLSDFGIAVGDAEVSSELRRVRPGRPHCGGAHRHDRRARRASTVPAGSGCSCRRPGDRRRCHRPVRKRPRVGDRPATGAERRHTGIPSHPDRRPCSSAIPTRACAPSTPSTPSISSVVSGSSNG